MLWHIFLLKYEWIYKHSDMKNINLLNNIEESLLLLKKNHYFNCVHQLQGGT